MLKLITILFVIWSVALQGSAQTFKAGAAIRDITPDHLIPISGGMGEPVMPTAYQGKLTVRALVLEKGTTKVAIVGIDNIGWPAYLGDRSRALIKEIAPENVLIGVTHTHSAPDAYGFPDENGNTGADLDYLNWCVAQIADAVNEAAKNTQPADLKTAVAEAKGKIAYNYYAPRLYDPRMGVIQALATVGEKKGKPIATLVNYATHPEILGTKRQLMSPDLCGPLYDRIESKAGGIALFMNSAQGGMVTADTRLENGGEANDWNECIRIGNLMADEALRIIAPAPIQQDPQLYCAAETIELPVENKTMQFVFKQSPVAKLAEKQTDDYSKVTTQVNLLNIGTAQALTIPGEALPNIGFFLKRHLKTEQPFLFGLTNDAFGYMLTKEDFNSFERYNYISRTSLGEMTAEIYEQAALKFIKESPAADK
ncbi:hypothetical protein [Maribellus sp. YY47]|uniref:hypothetical protein n=1 Tax=Maribellus sp. YY47 TaxID=2929486 RepID=UPI0020005C89|nr:hypothetical protein [Maribellus sp. YY47]MCK3682834.1 hypothetical protein [Maribellus sp. YY47]